MSKYIIKVTRQGPTSGIKGTHYYNGEDSCGNSYKIMLMAGHANTFTKQETKKI